MNKPLYQQLLNAAVVIFKRLQFDAKIEQCQTEIREQNGILYTKKKELNTPSEKYDSLHFWGRFLTIACGILSACVLFTAIMMFNEDPDTEIPLGVILFLCTAIPLTFLGIYFLVLARRDKIEVKEFKQKDYAYTENNVVIPTIAKLNAEIEKLKAEQNDFVVEHRNLIDFLPEKYQTADAIAFMLESIKNLRADTLTGLINLYEDELFRRQQLANSQHLLTLQEQQNMQMQEAVRSIEQGQEMLHSDLQAVQAMQFIDLIKQ